jgi:hypothetical protein
MTDRNPTSPSPAWSPDRPGAWAATVAGRSCRVVRGYAGRWAAYVSGDYHGGWDTWEDAQDAAERAARGRT